MTAAHLSRSRPCVVCELSPSSPSATLEYASSYCRERRAELVIVCVLEPESFRSEVSGVGGAPGTWGVIGAVAPALEAARRQGVVARVVIRAGERGRVLEDERRANGAERVITAADVPPERCAACGARYDPRAVHFCPRVHLDRAGERIESSAA